MLSLVLFLGSVGDCLVVISVLFSCAFSGVLFSYLLPLFLILFPFVVVPMLGFLCFACCHFVLFVLLVIFPRS